MEVAKSTFTGPTFVPLVYFIACHALVEAGKCKGIIKETKRLLVFVRARTNSHCQCSL